MLILIFLCTLTSLLLGFTPSSYSLLTVSKTPLLAAVLSSHSLLVNCNCSRHMMVTRVKCCNGQNGDNVHFSAWLEAFYSLIEVRHHIIFKIKQAKCNCCTVQDTPSCSISMTWPRSIYSIQPGKPFIMYELYYCIF